MSRQTRRGRLRAWLVAITAAALAVSLAAPASAILDGTVDSEDEFPFVAIAIDFSSGFFCSAGQIDAEHLVTAAHCFQDAIPPEFGGPPNTPVENIQVRFGFNAFVPEVVRTGTWYPAKWAPFSGPGLPGFDSRDLAVIKLDTPFYNDEYVGLAPVGLSDGLRNKTDVMLAGYGVSDFIPGGGPLAENAFFDGLRRFAPAELIASNHKHADEYLKVTGNPGQGKGGSCFGDSGSPLLYEYRGSWVMLANTSYGANGVCAGPGYYDRIDTTSSHEFISSIQALR